MTPLLVAIGIANLPLFYIRPQQLDYSRIFRIGMCSMRTDNGRPNTQKLTLASYSRCRQTQVD